MRIELSEGQYEMVLKCAEIAYEVNKVYSKSIGDDSFGPWEDAPQWQKDTLINGVIFHLSNPDAGPSASHDNWLKEKVDNGWVYGDIKDPDKKTHPCILPYDDLPESQKLKDSFFIAVVKTFMK